MKQISPFDGAPKTEIVTDDQGRRAFIVTPRYLTPWRFKVARFSANVTAWALMFALVFLVDHMVSEPGWEVLGALIAPWVLWQLWFVIARFMCSRTTRFELTEDTLKVGRLFGSRKFDRTIPNSFALPPHNSAIAEQRKHELIVRQEASKGRVIAKMPIYANSWHLSFVYLGQRNDLLTIYGQQDAEALLCRLQACNDVLNRQAGLAEGLSMSADDDWTDSPGDVG